MDSLPDWPSGGRQPGGDSVTPSCQPAAASLLGARFVRAPAGPFAPLLAFSKCWQAVRNAGDLLTVHGDQRRTAGKVIAVLDAGGMANQEMFYVQVSRVSRGFTLLTDDRETLIEHLVTSPDVPDIAFGALGEDFDAPVVDPDAWDDAVVAWEAVRREAESSPARRWGRSCQTSAGLEVQRNPAG